MPSFKPCPCPYPDSYPTPPRALAQAALLDYISLYLPHYLPHISPVSPQAALLDAHPVLHGQTPSYGWGLNAEGDVGDEGDVGKCREM